MQGLNFKTCWNSLLLNNDIVCKFTDTLATNNRKIEIATSTSRLNECVGAGQCSDEYKTFLQLDLLTKDLIVIPVNHKGNPGHWVVIGVFIRKKILVHLESLHAKNERTSGVILCFLKNLFMINEEPFDFSEWLLVSPLQVDSINCSVYACINAMSLIHLRLYPVPPAHINQLRYYIVSKASKCLPSKPFGTRRKSILQLEKPVFSSHNVESRFRFQNGTDTFESLHILVVGKKAGETT